MPRSIKVLVVDDSSLMRLAISEMINAHPDLEVIDTAGDGKEAIAKARQCQPDVIVLDMVMGTYGGLFAVQEILKQQNVPIIILSSLSNTHPEAVFEALDHGAFDFVAKPAKMLNSRIREIQQDLVGMVQEAAGMDRNTLSAPHFSPNQHQHAFDGQLAYDVVGIGASTGGPRVVESILTRLPSNFALPVVVAQHMPEGFINSFAQRLNGKVALEVKVAEEGERLEAGKVLLAGGDRNMVVQRTVGKLKIKYTDEQFPYHNRPSVDALFGSIARHCAARSILIMLTGMGKDGVEGMAAAHAKGAFTIAQDEATSVVFGMPGAAIQRQVVREVLPPKEIPGFVVSCL